uniref:Cathepsin L n=1 Tax=Lubomirskia baikalensis TaxID=289074 RepID=Q2PC17_9METZ|nr:cathepsin L [Lubomirskia baikalensis]CAI46307.1 cathepsin L [Lubomirskia baikalensis]
MKVLILLALVAAATAFDFPEEWESWKKEHGKVYNSDREELTRHIIWQANRKYVDEHNAHAEKFGFTVGMNQFADLESSEFGRLYNGYNNKPSMKKAQSKVFSTKVGDLPTSVDWRTKGFVTAIKNQGQCGSCWAFSAVAGLEGQHFNATGTLVSLSEQNLVDCSTAEGNQGCNGGLMDNAFQYVIKNGGIDTEASYPYKAVDQKCKFNAANVGSTCSGFSDILPHKSEAALQVAVAVVGPISVAIDASHTSFQLYKSGVYSESACSQTSLDHGVTAVGYDSSSGVAYWIVKNSWGTTWGQAGYIWMSRNKNNQCGIATAASYPIVSK